MQFVYKPEGARKVWPFEPGRIMNAEAEVIEKRTGMTFVQWTDAVLEGSMLATHGLLFVLLKRENPTLKWDDVQFCIDDVDFEPDEAETAKIIKALEEKDEAEGLSFEEREALAELRTQVETADAGDEDPKA